MIEVVAISVIILLICMVLFCVKILFKKNGKFPNTHIGGNPTLRKRGIKCAQAQHFEAVIQMNLSERMKRENL